MHSVNRPGDRGESTRIESCLARFEQDPGGAFEELINLVYERFRRLTAHILNQQFPDLHGQTDDAWHDALLKLRTALNNEKVAPRTRKELCGLAARHIRFALTDLVNRYRRDDQHAGIDDAADSRQKQVNIAVQYTTFNPAHLAAWTEFQSRIQDLDPDLREVIDLLFFGGLSQQEAADVLNLPLTTVQWRWRTAKIRLALAGGDILPD